MSHANVEIVKRGLDAFNRRDLEAFSGLATPDFEWFPALVGAVEGGSFRGREGLEAFGGEAHDTWQKVRAVGDDFRELGDRVLMLGRLEGRGRGSGVPVGAPLGLLFELRGGRISCVRAYLDHDEALRAAGLLE